MSYDFTSGLDLTKSMPKEWTPEMNKDFYESMARPIGEQTDINVGKARSEALSRGMEGDPFESLGVASARNNGTNSLSDLWANMSMQGADRAREERINNENREDNQDFQKHMQEESYRLQGLNDTNRSTLAERMANVNYDNTRGLEALQNRHGYQSSIWNGLEDVLFSSLKGAMAKQPVS